MGFVVQEKTYRLQWDATTDYDGMEVVAKPVPLGGFLQATELSRLASKNIVSLTREDAASLRAFFETIAGSLVSWNLERPTEDGTEPVPATVDGLLSLPLDLVMVIVGEWTSAVGGVAPPLPSGSGGGGTPKLPEVSLPMELLPASP